MQIQVTFRHIESSESIKEYAHEKIGKLQKYLDNPIEANITLTIEKHRHEADVIIVANGFKIHGQEIANDFFSAIDLVIDKIEKQIKRYREKLKAVDRGNKKVIDNFENKNLIEDQPRIVKTKNLTVKSMDIDDATMQLTLSNDNFFIFFNSRTEMINVIYKLFDGNFGLIEIQ